MGDTKPAANGGVPAAQRAAPVPDYVHRLEKALQHATLDASTARREARAARKLCEDFKTQMQNYKVQMDSYQQRFEAKFDGVGRDMRALHEGMTELRRRGTGLGREVATTRKLIECTLAQDLYSFGERSEVELHALSQQYQELSTKVEMLQCDLLERDTRGRHLGKRALPAAAASVQRTLSLRDFAPRPAAAVGAATAAAPQDSGASVARTVSFAQPAGHPSTSARVQQQQPQPQGGGIATAAHGGLQRTHSTAAVAASAEPPRSPRRGAVHANTSQARVAAGGSHEADEHVAESPQLRPSKPDNARERDPDHDRVVSRDDSDAAPSSSSQPCLRAGPVRGSAGETRAAAPDAAAPVAASMRSSGSRAAAAAAAGAGRALQGAPVRKRKRLMARLSDSSDLEGAASESDVTSDDPDVPLAQKYGAPPQQAGPPRAQLKLPSVARPGPAALKSIGSLKRQAPGGRPPAAEAATPREAAMPSATARTAPAAQPQAAVAPQTAAAVAEPAAAASTEEQAEPTLVKRETRKERKKRQRKEKKERERLERELQGQAKKKKRKGEDAGARNGGWSIVFIEDPDILLSS